MDLSNTIVPNSQQLNAEDLLSHPVTVTITGVSRGSVEQPVNIELAEYPGRPFRPSKTVRRILVAAWGVSADTYTGRRMTLYRDPDVKFGGQDVGGIRVSALSHIEKPMTVALTVTRGKRKSYTVQPLADAPPARTGDALFNGGDRERAAKRMFAEFNKHPDLTDRDDRLGFCGLTVGRPIASSEDLTTGELLTVADALAKRVTE